MASWQAAILQTALRWLVKHRTTIPIDPVKVRRRIHARRLPAALLARITPLNVNGIGGDRVSLSGLDAESSNLGVLYLHGGGYFFCSPQTHRPMTLGLAAHLRAPLFVPQYRLAPEAPYPAALDDAFEVYRHLQAREPQRRWLIAGDSAGGGLSLALAVRIRDAGLPAPLALLLYSPWTDLSCSGDSLRRNDHSCSIFTAAGVRDGARFYRAQYPADHPGISPLFADLRGLPPMLIFAAKEEALLDDSTRLVERARAVGVEVMYECVSGVPHVWPIFQRVLPEGRDTMRHTAAFVENLVARADYRASGALGATDAGGDDTAAAGAVHALDRPCTPAYSASRSVL